MLALFEFSFAESVTPRIAKALYRLAVAAAAVLAVLVAAAGLGGSLLSGLGWMVFGLLLFVVLVGASRIGLEAALVLFRIAEDAQEIAEHGAAIALNTSQFATRTSAIPERTGMPFVGEGTQGPSNGDR